MRVLITGGAGFIGSHLADRLLARGDDVLVIDNLATGRVDNLADNANLRFIEGTIADAVLVDEAVAAFQPEHVVHAAASYKDPDNWIEDTRTNVQGTINVIQAARKSGLKPGFLSRGHGGSLTGPVQVDTAVHHAAEVGDEPLLLAEVAPTVISVDRPAGAARLIALGCDFIILDDGFQNPKLAKDLNVVVVDARRGIGNGMTMPSGPLRAPISTPNIR